MRFEFTSNSTSFKIQFESIFQTMHPWKWGLNFFFQTTCHWKFSNHVLHEMGFQMKRSWYFCMCCKKHSMQFFKLYHMLIPDNSEGNNDNEHDYEQMSCPDEAVVPLFFFLLLLLHAHTRCLQNTFFTPKKQVSDGFVIAYNAWECRACPSNSIQVSRTSLAKARTRAACATHDSGYWFCHQIAAGSHPLQCHKACWWRELLLLLLFYVQQWCASLLIVTTYAVTLEEQHHCIHALW